MSHYYCLYFIFDQINVFQNIKKYTNPKTLNGVYFRLNSQWLLRIMQWEVSSTMLHFILYYITLYYIIINLRKNTKKKKKT